jgi:hypothetical protein
MSLNFADLSRAGARKDQSSLGLPDARALLPSKLASHSGILTDPRRGFKGRASCCKGK